MARRKVETPKDPEIEKLLRETKRAAGHWAGEFISSVKQQYKATGKISDRQREALMNIRDSRRLAFEETDWLDYDFIHDRD